MTTAALGLTGFIAGLLIGMNPVLISSFTAFVSSMIGKRASNNRYTMAGLAFIVYLVVFFIFFAVAIGTFISLLKSDFQLAFTVAVAMVSIITGLVLVRRYFWPKPIIKPSKDVTAILHDKTTKKTGVINIMALAMVVVYATLPTIGIAVLILSSISLLVGPNSLIWSIPFTIGLVTPIYGILALLSSGTKVSAIVKWKEDTKATMRLYNGLTIIALAWLLLFILAGGEVVF